MPDIEQDLVPQVATLWEVTGRDRYADPLVSLPREIPVRWEWTKAEIVDESGESVEIVATVVTKEPMKYGSLLYLGRLEDYSETGTASEEGQLLQVSRYKQAKDVRGRAVRHESMLKRYKKSLPS